MGKHIPKTMVSVILILYMIFAPSFLFSRLQIQSALISKENEVDYYGVIELWNVETFEGGSVARSLWLQARSIEFEKSHPGTFIIVRNMTPEQAILNLQNGNKPTLVSYGIGFGSAILSELTNYTGSVQVRDDLLAGGMMNDTIYAVPYLLGGYALIGNETLLSKASISQDSNLLENVYQASIEKGKTFIPSLCFGSNAFTNAPLALFENTQNEATQTSIENTVNELDSYLAYQNYVLERSSILLGTQRDVYRTKNRENNGNMEPNLYYFLGGFSDLVQYMSICNTDNATKAMCEKFIEYITSEAVQKTIVNIAMFSVLDMSIYSDVFYHDFEKVLQQPLKTLSVFLHTDVITYNIETARQALFGKSEAREKIKEWF